METDAETFDKYLDTRWNKLHGWIENKVGVQTTSSIDQTDILIVETPRITRCFQNDIYDIF